MTSPRTVLHVMNGPSGGAALSTLGLIEALRDAGVESYAVCHRQGTPAEREHVRDVLRGRVEFTWLYWTNKKIRVAPWKRPLIEALQLARSAGTLASTAVVARAAHRAGAELIHSSTILTPEGAHASRLLRLPHLWHLREMVGPGKPFRFAWEGPHFDSYLARRCELVVANSEATAAQIRPWVAARRLAVVPNGIDLSRFVVRARASSGPVVVAMVGSLVSRWKKHRLFVDAAARVDRSLPVRFRIYGHGAPGEAYADEIRAAVRAHGLDDRFEWPGFVDDTARMMSEVDVLAHPADGESFGRILVEAMASGVPIATVDGGAAPEVVAHEQTGLVTPVDDAAALAASIERLARDPDLRARMGDAGRRRAEERFSLQAHAVKMLELYGAVLRREAVA